MVNNRRILTACLLFTLLLVSSCDYFKPKKEFRLAVPEKDYFYNYMASSFVPFLENMGYKITVIKATTSFEANRLVATQQADLCFINNHSVTVTEKLGKESANLRTIMPITKRLFLAFSRTPLPDSASIKELLENKRIGIEMLGGEAAFNLQRFIDRAKIRGTQLVSFQDNPDVVIFWGTFYGVRAEKYLHEGWQQFSFKKNWLEFITANEPALSQYTLPAVPGDSLSKRINTVMTDALLVTNSSMGEKTIYELSATISNNRLGLIHQDIMYKDIREDFDQSNMLYPVHKGASAYISRDQPSFFERFADTIALIFSVIAVLYAGLQAIYSNMAKRKKDRVDKYFLQFLEIRQNKELRVEQKVKKLDELFQHAVEQMTNEKLDKSDFHILSRLIQQDLTILRFDR